MDAVNGPRVRAIATFSQIAKLYNMDYSLFEEEGVTYIKIPALGEHYVLATEYWDDFAVLRADLSEAVTKSMGLLGAFAWLETNGLIGEIVL